MITFIATLFLFLAISPEPGELMLRLPNSRPLTLEEIYVHRYQPFKHSAQFVELEPGRHPVFVDVDKKYVLGYIEEIQMEGKVYHVLAPFTEPAIDRRVKEERVKLIINGKFAHASVKIDPNDVLNDMFFESVQQLVGYVVFVTALPIPVVE